MKILLLDIETAPHLAHVWGIWQQNVGLPQLLDSSYTLCWAAKWLGEDEIFQSSLNQTGPKTMLKPIHKLLSEADAVVHYNGAKFDIPTLNKEFVIHGMLPPAPYKQIDLLKTVRQQFRFASNKMAYVLPALGLGEKGDSGGHETWVGCMNGDQEAWETLEKYNIEDVVKLEELYVKLKPWIKSHPNQSIYLGARACPTCGGTHSQRRGYVTTSAYRYPRFRCNDCGSWFRGAKSDTQKPAEKFIGIGA